MLNPGVGSILMNVPIAKPNPILCGEVLVLITLVVRRPE